MANRKQRRYERKVNVDRFRKGIKGKVLDAISISNELDCRYLSLEFEDKTELTITLDNRLTRKLELFDWQNGDQRLIRKVGLIPDDDPLWRPKE